MARRKVVVERSSGGGMGVLGVVIGALLVIGAVFVFANGSDMFASKGGGTNVTINAPKAPSLPSMPSTTGQATR